jgi:tetratricopeptide (TPR) repeat protein
MGINICYKLKNIIFEKNIHNLSSIYIMSRLNQLKNAIAVQKKRIFFVFLFLSPIFILLLIEVPLRIFNYGTNYSLFVTHPDSACSAYNIVNPVIGSKYFHNIEYSTPTNDFFKKKKNKNCFRIFVLGSSSVLGFPYNANLSFPRMLQARLQLAYPEKDIEVINTSIAVVNSYTLLDYMNDILDAEPDALLIYDGHYEYYGAFGVGSNEGIGKNRTLILLHLKLMNLKVYQLINNAIRGVTASISNNAALKQSTLMARIVKKTDIAFNNSDYELGLQQFNENMSAILEKAKKKNVPVFISTLVSNISDLKPFGSIKSENGESAADYYAKGQLAKQQGKYKLAKELLTKARDYDCVRFRASSDINNSIESLAKKYDAHLVPVLQVFEDNSPNGLVGNNLLTEHVHPNISGYFLMTDIFYNTICQSNLVGDEINKYANTSASYFKNNYGYTGIDSILGFQRIENMKCHWPFRDETKSYIDYRKIYKPKDKYDTIAFNIMAFQKTSLFGEHVRLAKMFMAQNNYVQARKEYLAAVMLDPSYSKILREAASCFILAGDLPLALEYFNKSLLFEQSYFAYFKAGEIYLIMNDYSNAIQYLTKAYELVKKEEYKIPILTKLYIAYIYQKQNDEAKQVYELIKNVKPGITIDVPIKEYTFCNYIPVQISDMVNESRNLIENKNLDEALTILLKALEINDSPVLNRMLGELYFKMGNFKLSAFYMQKAFEWLKFEPTFLVLLFQADMASKQYFNAKLCLNQYKIIGGDRRLGLSMDKMLKDAR